MSFHTARKAPSAWWVGVVAGMASYIDAAAIVSNGIALVIYQSTIGITPGQIGVMSGALTLCIAVGALVGGRLGDRFGRRRVFLVTMSLIVIGSALATVGTTYGVLLAGVVLTGIGVGADLPVSLASIAEAASDRNRGAIIQLSNILWGLGIVSSVTIVSVTGDLGHIAGQLLYGQVGVVALVVLIMRLSIPESTFWLEARDRRLSGGEPPRGQLRGLLKAPYAKPFIALTVFYALTNLGANTSGQFSSYIAANYAGTTVEVFNRWALIMMPIGLLGSVVFMKFVDSRRRMAFFTVGAGLVVANYVYLALAGFSLRTMVVALLLANLGGAFAFEGIMKVWTQESFPTMLRSTVQGAIIAVARISAALLAAVTPALLQVSTQGMYTALAVITAGGFLIGGLAFRGTARNEFRSDEPPAPVADADAPSLVR